MRYLLSTMRKDYFDAIFSKRRGMSGFLAVVFFLGLLCLCFAFPSDSPPEDAYDPNTGVNYEVTEAERRFYGTEEWERWRDESRTRAIVGAVSLTSISLLWAALRKPYWWLRKKNLRVMYGYGWANLHDWHGDGPVSFVPF